MRFPRLALALCGRLVRQRNFFSVLLILFWGAAGSEAQETNVDNWVNPGTGLWNDGNNWSFENPPGAQLDASVVNGGKAIINGGNVTAGNLTIGAITAGGAVEIANRGDLQVAALTIGPLGTLTVDEGSSFQQTGGFTNNGNLIINSGTVNTAAIGGTGTITKISGGTLTWEAPLDPGARLAINDGTFIDASSSIGTATVNGGTSVLQINAGITLNITPTLNNGGTLRNQGFVTGAGDAVDSTVGGATVINQADGVIQGGANNAIHFDQGGTVVNAGRISANGLAGILVDGLAGTVTNSGTIAGNSAGIVLNAGGTVTNLADGAITGVSGILLTGGGSISNQVSGVISGTNGTAVLALEGAVAFSNAGQINGNVNLQGATNTVTLFIGGRIAGNLTSNPGGALTLDGAGVQLLSNSVTGSITGFNSLTKDGAGTWIIDRMLDAPVSTNILAGVLTVNSSLRSQLVTVQAGAMLRGSGNVIGSVTNFGTLSPGNSPGTLTINGNYSQGPAGVYNVEIESANNYSRLIVTGHANLDGTLRLTLASGFKPRNGSQFKVLTAGQGISGTFRNVTSNEAVNVSYANGAVNVNAGPANPVITKPGIHLSDGTPVSTTALMANNSFYGFEPLSQRAALGSISGEESGQTNAITITFDAGEFDIQGNHGEAYGLPIAGGFGLNDRFRLNYEIPLQYVRVSGTTLFQAGLTLDLPTKLIIASEEQPWSWDITPTAAFATSGSKEILGGGALSNLVTYRWHGMSFTYGSYLSFFEGSRLTSNDAQFPTSVDQQIMKNGVRADIPFAKSWIFECYGIRTDFFQTAAVSSYYTVGVSLAHHFILKYGQQPIDLGYLSLGYYNEFGNHYSSNHGQIGSAWRF